ncbi:sulfatase [Zobellia sp. OII3]|uniref:sulfatase n=1 Tax=Zobellia sp. OII3 TaxID=2034520 RepID=UPI000B53600E|nr:sulfatase [Zobellia sp. OII3]OWW23565.1 sulfatase [Zobellia sp. OII3]
MKLISFFNTKIALSVCVFVVLSLSGFWETDSFIEPVLIEESRPNVLFIAIDDLRPELGAYGNKIIQTPNLDALANEGLLFNNHFVQVPTCGASRYSLMTGLRPRAIKHLSNDVFEKDVADQPEKDRPESFIHQLRRKGYYTVGMGKLSHSADGLVYGYEEQPSSKRELPYSWDEYLFDSGKWNTGWNAFFGYEDGENRQSMKKQVKPYEAGNVEDEGYPDGLTAKLAIDKLKELKGIDAPFFLGVGFFKPHLPFNAPKKYWDLYDREKIPIAPDSLIPKRISKTSLHNSGEFNGYQLTDEIASLDHPLSDDYSRKLIHAYYAAVSYVDAQVGRLVNQVEALGLSNNTIIVIWGDHGWHLGNDRVWGKHTLFETALRSPLIIKVPAKNTGKINTIIETVDIYPTLLELCKADNNIEIDGKSFAELFEDKNAITENDVAYSYFKKGMSMREKRFRITKYCRDEKPIIELYDHKVDPLETENVALKKPEVVKTLMPLLEKGNTGLYTLN